MPSRSLRTVKYTYMKKNRSFIWKIKQLYLGIGSGHQKITLEIRAYKSLPTGSAINGFTGKFNCGCARVCMRDYIICMCCVEQVHTWCANVCGLFLSGRVEASGELSWIPPTHPPSLSSSSHSCSLSVILSHALIWGRTQFLNSTTWVLLIRALLAAVGPQRGTQCARRMAENRIPQDNEVHL